MFGCVPCFVISKVYKGGETLEGKILQVFKGGWEKLNFQGKTEI